MHGGARAVPAELAGGSQAGAHCRAHCSALHYLLAQLGELVLFEHVGEEQHRAVELGRVDGAPPVAVEHTPELDERPLIA